MIDLYAASLVTLLLVAVATLSLAMEADPRIQGEKVASLGPDPRNIDQPDRPLVDPAGVTNGD